MLMFSYTGSRSQPPHHVQHCTGDDEYCDKGEDGGSGDKAGIDLFGHDVEPEDESVVRLVDVVHLIVGVDDLIPDVGHPQAGQKQDEEDEEDCVLAPEGDMGTDGCCTC